MNWKRLFGIEKVEPAQAPPSDPVFCHECARFCPDPAPRSVHQDVYEFAKCDMGEPRVRYERDFVSGEMKAVQLYDTRHYCAIKNDNGQCRDFIPKSDQIC